MGTGFSGGFTGDLMGGTIGCSSKPLRLGNGAGDETDVFLEGVVP